MDLQKAKETFRCPPMAARPAPFWFWNDRLDPERLVGQFDRLLDAGMGGAVLHARGGLDPEEYLDERWFAGIKAVIERAAERGALVWLYDELGWPSGTAGGRIPRERPELRMVQLRLHDITLGSEEDARDLKGDVVAAFHVTRTDPNRGFQRRHDGSGLLQPDRIRCEPISWPIDPAQWLGKRLLIFEQVRLAGCLNYFDPKATEAFIRSTHEQYYRRFAKHFGKTITHSFMDETGMFGSIASLPWDVGLADDFQSRYGYSLIPRLPALFFEVPGSETVRFDYWSLVTARFRERFAIPMHEWCEAHHIAYSGHYLCEATLKEAARQLGSTMPLYEYQGMPGIDILGNDFYSRRFEQEAYSYYVVTIKQAASVNHQLAKGGVMSESYGVGGHAMGPEAMQTATNFQMALGVTFINQHAAFYSLRAERKYDCPPAIDWHEPYWRFVKKHVDTISRTGWLLNQGRHVCDVLLLHPAASMQATYRLPRTRDEYKAENYLFDADMRFELVDKHFTLISAALLDAQIDHDYGDEELMARYAAAEKGLLRVGRASYRIVVLPPLVNIRASTLELLRAFAAQVGAVLALGSAARLIDGRPSNEVRTFLENHAVRIIDGVDCFDYGPAIAALTERGARTVTLKTAEDEDPPEIKAQRRAWDGREILYLANVSREAVSARMTCALGVTGRIEEWDPATGETRPMAKCVAGKELQLDVDWAAREAKAFVAVPGEVEIPQRVALSERRRIRPEWEGARTGPNVLVLDECRVVDGDQPGQRLSIAQAQSVLAQRLKVQGGPVRLTVQFPFTASAAPDEPLGGVPNRVELAAEFCADPELRLNGEAAPMNTLGSVLDPAIQRIALPALQPGENTLEITATYERPTHLQSPWLLGEFRAVSEDSVTFTLANDRGPIGIGSWPKLGLPFYAGTVVYRTEVDLTDCDAGQRVVLDMPGLAGSAEIRVNGRVADHVLWPPYECDITSFVQRGKNTVEVEVANTLRNLLGPHYEPNEDIMTGMSDDSYRGAAGEPKRFREYGLVSPPEMVISA